ncbi:hypothetical protein MSAS_12570 [Mycobacterium saskatchewanense]|uniref:Uncharacterized protein n=1 Tax=Mycobacterium saskatchewanense TaxID=220927 RepID=A0AAJ3NKU4_9MYCO|nr:hypothetical protein [Mycobacterium saskatchewanense]ORW64239.1 hypothetical protein AWC23_26595 [Mycobacterium saskatchewanense]BBX62083.1 hypothetical protein MSAS_12570 [Mycobacterium saskatchewanense]
MNPTEVFEASASTKGDEVVVAFHDAALLLGGAPAAVESYLARLRAAAGQAMRVAGIDGASLAGAASRLAGLAALLADSGTYVQLHRDSMDALRDGNLVPLGEGVFRLTTGADPGQFLERLQWQPALLGPEAMMSAQMIAVQMALKSAVAQVEDAVRRVEDKVEAVLDVARAQRAGDVLGNNLTLSRMVDSLEKYGSLPEAYWDSVAALGPALNVTVEQLRDHVRRILASFDQSLPVHHRAGKLRSAVGDNRLGDALSLLVITEESLHKWQRLSLARIESTQPEHLLRAIDEARELVEHHLREDLDIYRHAKDILDRVAKSEAIDGFRFSAVRELVRQRGALRDDFDRFAEARQHQAEVWEDFHIPSVFDAALAAVGTVGSTTGRVFVAVGRGLVSVGEHMTRPLRSANSEGAADIMNERCRASDVGSG